MIRTPGKIANMPKDYARAHRRSPAKDGGSSRNLSTAMTFGAGSVFGAIVTFVVLVGINWQWQAPATTTDAQARTDAHAGEVANEPPGGDEADDDLRYRFFDRLKNANVDADVTPYEELTPEPDTPREFVIQTASFVNAGDAEKLRGELILSGMSATLDAVEVEGRGPRYRVLVGPYATRLKAGSAINRLRETGLDPLLLSRAIVDP